MKYATALVSILIVIAVLIPGSNLPDVGIGGFDKLIHVAMFGTWAVAVRYDFNIKPFPWLFTFFVGLLFSGLTEILQLVVEGRTFDVYDMVADTIGLVAGLLVSGPILKKVHRSR
jgi:VanZ family protein